MSPGKDIPKIEFGPLVRNGVVHMVPVIQGKIMLGHKFSGECCGPTLTKTAGGQPVMVHNVIH